MKTQPMIIMDRRQRWRLEYGILLAILLSWGISVTMPADTTLIIRCPYCMGGLTFDL